MSSTMTELILRLKKTNIISSRPDLIAMLVAINKFYDNESLQAYLLGNFFKYKIDSDNLLPHDKDILIQTIKRQKLEPYFYLKTKPDDNTLGLITYIFAFGGLFAIIGGCIQLANGSFSYGLGTKYLVPVMREGGIFVIMGLGFLLAGIIRLRRDRRKKILIKALTNIPNNCT